MGIDKTVINGWAKNRTKPFKMTRQSMSEGGFLREYEGYRELGLHECVNCHTDIPETFEYDCIAYPVQNEAYTGFLCGRCHDETIHRRGKTMSKEKIKRCEDSLSDLVKRLNFYEDQLRTMVHGMGLLLKDLNSTKSEIASAMVALKNNTEVEE